MPNGSSNCVDPVKNAIAAGTVRACVEDVSVIASRNSFQATMNVRIPAVARPGAASGTTTFRNASKFVAPSTSAASSRSLGYLPEERREDVDRQRQRERQVRDDQAGIVL